MGGLDGALEGVGVGGGKGLHALVLHPVSKLWVAKGLLH